MKDHKATSDAPPLVLYHDRCPDGWCAAYLAQRAMPTAELVPVNYGQPPPDVSGRRVYILDFSYKRDILLQMAQVAQALIVLDHHKTAQEELAGLEGCCYIRDGHLYPDPPGCWLNVVFDMTHSGAYLAWDAFTVNKCGAAPWLVRYVEDRDLWKWSLKFSREVNVYIGSYNHDIAAWDHLAKEINVFVPDHVIHAGEAILRHQFQQVERICKNAREVVLGGHRVLAVNTYYSISEVAGKLAEGRPFGACWFVRSDGKVQWSLRSRKGGEDVAAIAKAYGGGGHRNSAGFEEEGPQAILNGLAERVAAQNDLLSRRAER